MKKASQEALDWAEQEMKKIEAIGRENIKLRPYSEFKANVLKRRAKDKANDDS